MSTFIRVIRHELIALARDPAFWLATGAFCLLVAAAVLSGARWVNAHAAEVEAVLAEEGQRFGVMQMTLIRIEGGRALPGTPDQDPTRPAAVGRSLGERNAVLPPAPLAPLAIGQADLLPSVIPVSTESRYGLPSREDIANPLHLLTGRLDLAFVVLFLLPLLILVLGFDLLSREREEGTLAILLSQPVRLGTVLAGKIFARGAVILGAGGLFTAIGLAVAGTPRTTGLIGSLILPLVLWGAVAAAYTGFWLGLAAVVNLFGRSSAQQAVILAGAWLLFAVVIPSALTTTARTLHPVPSRAEMIGAEREAAQIAQGEGSGLLARYLEDHPELVPGGEAELDEFFAVSHAVQAEVDRRMEPVRRHYDRQIAGQRRLVEGLRFLSPVLVARSSLDDLAGTGTARHLHFQAQVESFRSRFQEYFDPLIRDQERFTSQAVSSIPAWSYREEPRADLLRRVGIGLLGLLLPTALVGAAARRGGSRYTPST